MSQQVEAPAKFLPSEWRHANQTQFGSAAAARARSEKLTAECKRLIEESEKSARRIEQDANRRLDQRLKDIRFWKEELDQKQHEMVQEIEVLVVLKSRVEKALEGCSEPLKATVECTTERMKRMGIDLVHDNVDKELMKEKEVVEGVMTLLQRTLEQINEQIRLIRSVKYYLDRDLQDKFQAERIDDFCAMLTSTSSNIEEQKALEQTKGGYSTKVSTHDWESSSNINISNAERERNNSLSLRTLVESVLEQTAVDMQRQHQATSMALELRIQETKNAKAQLEGQLDKLLAEISSQIQNLEALKVAIEAKQAPLSLAQARLKARSQRPKRELCQDPVHFHLLSEVEEISGHIARLKEGLVKSEVELKALIRNQVALEEEIQVKANSLYIDEVLCIQLHQSVIIHNF